MGVRRVPDISAAENPRLETIQPGFVTVRCDSVEPVPVGTLVAMMFRVTSYGQDCDGTLLATLESVNISGRLTGWTQPGIALSPESAWVLDTPRALDLLASTSSP